MLESLVCYLWLGPQLEGEASERSCPGWSVHLLIGGRVTRWKDTAGNAEFRVGGVTANPSQGLDLAAAKTKHWLIQSVEKKGNTFFFSFFQIFLTAFFKHFHFQRRFEN